MDTCIVKSLVQSWRGSIAATALGIVLTAISFPEIGSRQLQARTDPSQIEEVMYLPRGPALGFLSFGYRNALADALWFQTINYFGKHYRGNKDYRWLAHMCNLVVDLNPSAPDPYRFCGTMLAWEGDLPEEAIQILSKALQHRPDDWIFYYVRGFTYAYFFEDEDHARADFVKAASLPGAHPLVIRLAAKKLLDSHSPTAAIDFLRLAIANAPDSQTRTVFESRLRETIYELDLRELEAGLEEFKQLNGRAPESMQELLRGSRLTNTWQHRSLEDPFGGTYGLGASGNVESSSGHKRPKLSWKNAEENSSEQPR